jgi:hypothetical protein
MTTMQQKRGTSSRWTSTNPLLLAGEIGIETDTNRMKVGDGVTNWNSLDYITIKDELLTAGNNDLESLLYIENATIIDTVVASEWRNLKYVISMSKTSDSTNKFATTELNILVDGSNVTVNEYGAIDNNGEVGTVNVSQSGGNIQINVIPNLLVKPITVRYYRTGLKA